MGKVESIDATASRVRQRIKPLGISLVALLVLSAAASDLYARQ